jgi:hypothetical protein
MRRLNLFGAAIIATLALAAIIAGTAGAAGPVLNFEVGKTPVANGSVAVSGFAAAGCFEFSEGTVTANGKKKDKAAFTNLAFSECSEGESLTGMITSAKVSSAGVASFKANMVLSQAGPCLYAIKKFTVNFNVPGEALAEGEAVAKAGKGSAKTCTKSITLPIQALLGNEVFGSAYELALS